MRVLHITHQYHPAIGGAERYITDLSEELAQRGHQVDVFTSRSVDYHTWHNELPCSERLNGVNVYRFRSLPRTQHVWRVLEYGLGNYLRKGAWRYEPFIFYGNGPICPGIFVAVLRQAQQYDLIHINNLHYSHALTAYIAARLRRLPIVITPHVHAEQRETHDVGYMRMVLHGSDVVLAVTQAEKEYLAGRGWNPEIVVGGVGLPLDRFPQLDPRQCRARFNLPEDGIVILFLGRKTGYKGLEACLEAFVALRQKRQDIYFLAAGPETDFSRQLWLRYDGLDGLVVRGAVSNEERLAALAACDVLAMPSAGEAFGIVYLEAWAYCKPVIGAKIISVSSLISDGVDGFLVQPSQVAQLINYLKYLADDREMAQTMGERGRAKLEKRYTIERVADIMEGVYARTVRRHRTLLERDLKCASA
jgi:glycosyltransferase involved in cell wall biosynthesis